LGLNFWECDIAQSPYFQGFQALPISPNPQKRNITMSWSNVIYSVWGKRIYPLHYVKVGPHSMVIAYGMFRKV